VIISFKLLTKKFVEDGTSEFQIFCVIFHRFQALLPTRFSQLGYVIISFAQDGFRKCSRVRRKHREWLRLLQIFRAIPQRDDEFFNHNIRVTGDETSVSLVNSETKEQSKQWKHTHSSHKSKKFKQTSACQKANGNLFSGTGKDC
jgi:hypothetical protein